MSIQDYDVVVVGSGIVGATTALILAKNTSLKIAILEANDLSVSWDANSYDHRVSAISASSQKIFQNLNIWQAMTQKRVSAYTHMRVWDVEENAEIKFDCADVNEQELGFIVEDSIMRSSLLEEMRKYGNIELLFSRKLVSISAMPSSSIIPSSSVMPAQAGIQLTTNVMPAQAGIQLTAEVINTKLLIAADGANSYVRDLAGIQLKTWDYEHTAIVATVETELSHQKTAMQQFLTTGPLAFLPLNDANTSSIVWSASHAHAKELMALSDEEFRHALSNAFNNKLGQIKKISKRYSFPLRMRHAKNYVQPSLALIGDAAHTIHPLAGQGVNLGLLDAASLSEVIIEAVKKNKNYSSSSVLRRYERWRKSDNVAMLAGVEVLKRLFANNNPSMKRVRGVGLAMTNRVPLLKNFFTQYALGHRGDLPVIAK